MLFSKTVRARRAALASQFDVRGEFEVIEESCIPSYLHRNPLAAWTAWSRLGRAAALYGRHAPDGDILDFGSGSGELRQVLSARGAYHFVEGNDVLAAAVTRNVVGAQRETLQSLGQARFAAIFALDSLEHNEDIAPILSAFAGALRPDGVFILSGPSENALYRFGRRLAGFDGHYHLQTIYDIERMAQARFSPIARALVPFGAPLFAVSCWKAKAS